MSVQLVLCPTHSHREIVKRMFFYEVRFLKHGLLKPHDSPLLFRLTWLTLNFIFVSSNVSYIPAMNCDVSLYVGFYLKSLQVFLLVLSPCYYYHVTYNEIIYPYFVTFWLAFDFWDYFIKRSVFNTKFQHCISMLRHKI